MTIIEQLVQIKNETCDFACMFKEYLEDSIKDPKERNEKLRGYCNRCPLNRLSFKRKHH